MLEKKIQVQLVGKYAHTAYISLPGHRPEPGIVAKTIMLHEILDYKGPRVHLDIDGSGTLIGIEILT